MRLLAFAVVVLFVTPAAAWTVRSDKDPMTDRSVMVATAQSGAVRLVIACTNGEPQPRLAFGQRIGWGDIGVSFRVDDGPVVPRMAMVAQDGRELWPWIGDVREVVGALRRAKRLRVSLSGMVFDFDLAAGEKLPALKC